jgi:hypothetical protein
MEVGWTPTEYVGCHYKKKFGQVLVTHAHNHSYLRGYDPEDQGPGPAQANSL